MAPSSETIDAFRSKFDTALMQMADRTGSVEQRCLILSGGVDTCAILEACHKLDITFGAAVTVICGDESPDLGYCQAASAHRLPSVPHHIVRITPHELVETYLPICIQLLQSYDGMTLRNSLVIAAAFQKIHQLNNDNIDGSPFKHVVVGDGADELFGGYSFMWRAPSAVEWKEKRDSMCRKWTFSTPVLADHYGLSVEGPYMDPAVVDWALSQTCQDDCIGDRPIQLRYGGEYQDHTTGKLVLREAYKTFSSWRRKDPIEVGSGVTVIGHNLYWKDIISDEEYEDAKAVLAKRGFNIRSKEYLVNFRCFEKIFGPSGVNATDWKRLELGKGCVDCCFDVGDAMFCHMCGAYPAQRETASE